MTQIVQYNAQDIMAEFDTYYAEGYRAWGQSYPAMAQDLHFYLGDQWIREEQQYLREQGRHAYVFNKLKSKIDWIDGYQIQNRLSSVCVPVMDGLQKTADQQTKLLINNMAQADGYINVSKVFSSGNKTGWALLNVYLDYNEDPVNGDIKYAVDPYSAFIMDPYFTKLDLSDCNWVAKRKYLSPLQCEILLPDQEEEVRALAHDGWERDNKFTWMVFQRVPTGQRMMAYNEFFRLKYKQQKVLVNPMTKQMADWDGDADTYMQLEQAAKQQGVDLEVMYRKKQFIEKHIIINNTYMRTEINPYGLDEYPFAFYSPIFEPESEEYTYKVQSLIRQLKDPQRELNRRRSQMIDIVEAQLNTGWIEEDGAVKNPKMLYQSGQAKRIVLNKDYKMDSLQQLQPIQVPGSYFNETQMAEKDLMDILGLNETTFGTQESKQVSALVEKQRMAASLTGLQGIFDNIRECQKQISRKTMKLQQQWSPHKIKMIIGEEPTQEFYDKTFLKYDIVIEEGILTDTQKYMFFRQLLELKELGEPIPPGLITKEAPIQGKSELYEAMDEYQKQQQQQMQQLQQAEQQQTQALTHAASAKAISDLALSKERQARAIADLSLMEERNAEAIKNREQAGLERIKAMQEMQHLETDHKAKGDARIMDLLRFVMEYEAHQKAQQQATAEMQQAKVETLGQSQQGPEQSAGEGQQQSAPQI